MSQSNAHLNPAARRALYFAAREAERVENMPKVGRWLYLHRHTLAFLARWVIIFALCFVTAWAWLLAIGIPLYSWLSNKDKRGELPIFPHD